MNLLENLDKYIETLEMINFIHETHSFSKYLDTIGSILEKVNVEANEAFDTCMKSASVIGLYPGIDYVSSVREKINEHNMWYHQGLFDIYDYTRLVAKHTVIKYPVVVGAYSEALVIKNHPYKPECENDTYCVLGDLERNLSTLMHSMFGANNGKRLEYWYRDTRIATHQEQDIWICDANDKSSVDFKSRAAAILWGREQIDGALNVRSTRDTSR